jgi:hypothetical protein
MTMKLVAQINIRGQEATKVLTTVNSITTVASSMRTIVGVGKPFLIFNSLSNPDASLVGADFTDAPLVSNDVAANVEMINLQLANPQYDKLLWG